MPKKLASIWVTRNYDVDHPAAAQIRPGCRVGATLAVKDRRLAEASIALSGAPSEPIGFLALPTYGLMGAPSLMGEPSPGAKRLIRAVVSAKTHGPSHAGRGRLTLFAGPRDELHLLSPTSVLAASVCTYAFTVNGVATGE
jgi:hypothetical protein